MLKRACDPDQSTVIESVPSAAQARQGLDARAAAVPRSSSGFRRAGDRLAEEQRRRIGQCGPAVRTLRRQAEPRAQAELAVPGASNAGGLLAGSLLRLRGGLPTDRLARGEEKTEGGGEHHSTTTASPACSRNPLARPRPRDKASKVKRMRVSSAWRRRTKIRSR